ncbi:hypothetical protein [Streptomyces sp. CAU 1734]|uniref:hypothetical protein n=1 Tax=Streptomyces sp. CAU 1734 TaxID=3140360 RepID=UPI003261D074
MSTRQGAKTRRAVTAVLVAAALSLSLTACGDDGDGGADKKNVGSTAVPPGTSGGSDRPADDPDGGIEAPADVKTLGTVKGSNGFEFTITGAARDEGGFLTISGTVANTSGKSQVPPIQWNGQESQVKRTGRSFAGMTLVDKKDKKRYYVLRDTDGYPLTTTGLTPFGAGESVDFFAQFPAPPEATTSVEVQIPLMPSTTIEIS